MRTDRVLHTIVVVSVLVILGIRLTLSDTVPTELWALVSMIGGGYFGAAVPHATTPPPLDDDAPRHAATPTD